jgi:succinate dehydrogenase/fumarate reductase-like Fe-S protein
LALELVFELGIGLGPEGLEVFCDLHGTVARGEDMERERMAAEGFGSCSNQLECEAVCPKQISADWISWMNRELRR